MSMIIAIVKDDLLNFFTIAAIDLDMPLPGGRGPG